MSGKGWGHCWDHRVYRSLWNSNDTPAQYRHQWEKLVKGRKRFEELKFKDTRKKKKLWLSVDLIFNLRGSKKPNKQKQKNTADVDQVTKYIAQSS